MLVHLAELYDKDVADFFERGHMERSLSHNERELVDIYRDLDADGKLLVSKTVQSIAEFHYKG